VDAPHDRPSDDEALLDDYRALTDPERRRQVERAGEFFVVEGLLGLEALLGSRHPVRSILTADTKLERVRRVLDAAPGAADAPDAPRGAGVDAPTVAPSAPRAGPPAIADIPVIVRPAAEVAALTGFAFHRGVLASAARVPLPAVADLIATVRTVAVLEGLNDHENLGALFRNAAAFGVDAVLLDPTTADPLYRRSVRVSLGHVLRVPWTRLAAWPEALADVRARGFTVLALTPGAGAESIEAVAASPPARVAWLLGAEGPGLSSAALAAADRRVRISIAAGVDSLNVATAAAIAFHRLAGRT
jgi:tRNA G18 (ribose-2'-O)-methylase SpoU